MKINTYQFGEIEFDSEKAIKFSRGLFGFENLKEFLLIKSSDDDLFYWLNSIDNPDMAFPLIGIRVIDEKFPSVDEHEAFSIVTLNNDPLKVTANLKAPVYINQESSTGFQKVIDTDKYPVSYSLFKETPSAGERQDGISKC